MSTPYSAASVPGPQHEKCAVHKEWYLQEIVFAFSKKTYKKNYIRFSPRDFDSLSVSLRKSPDPLAALFATIIVTNHQTSLSRIIKIFTLPCLVWGFFWFGIVDSYMSHYNAESICHYNAGYMSHMSHDNAVQLPLQCRRDMYSQSHLECHFRKLKAQSSNVSFSTFRWKDTFELWALSLRTAFENVSPSGIICTNPSPITMPGTSPITHHPNIWLVSFFGSIVPIQSHRPERLLRTVAHIER